jgi:hypothetical protein
MMASVLSSAAALALARRCPKGTKTLHGGFGGSGLVPLPQKATTPPSDDVVSNFVVGDHLSLAAS